MARGSKEKTVCMHKFEEHSGGVQNLDAPQFLGIL